MEDEGGAEYDEGDQFRDQRAWHRRWGRMDPTHHPCLSFPFFSARSVPPSPQGRKRVGEAAPPVAQRPRGMQVEDVRRPSGGCAAPQQ